MCARWVVWHTRHASRVFGKSVAACPWQLALAQLTWASRVCRAIGLGEWQVLQVAPGPWCST